MKKEIYPTIFWPFIPNINYIYKEEPKQVTGEQNI